MKIRTYAVEIADRQGNIIMSNPNIESTNPLQALHKLIRTNKNITYITIVQKQNANALAVIWLLGGVRESQSTYYLSLKQKSNKKGYNHASSKMYSKI